MRTTHTYVELELSRAAYDEIRTKLLAAGYHQNFQIHDKGDGPIDMQDIAVTPLGGSRVKRRFLGLKPDAVVFLLVCAGIILFDLLIVALAVKGGHK